MLTRATRLIVTTLALSSLTLIASCAAPTADKKVATAEVDRMSRLPAVTAPADNPITPEKIALGKQLFFDTRMSGSGTMACENCHYRDKGWAVPEALSKQDSGKLNTRHTPTLYNVAYNTIFYWDGRAATMEAQTLAAWRNQMNIDPPKIAERLNAIPEYKAAFNKAYGTDATPENIVKSFTTYLRTLTSGDSPWDRHEKGMTGAVSDDAKAGFTLFMGKGRCAVCHTPPVYMNNDFHNIGLEAGKEKPDLGRFNVTKKVEDTSAFKTPQLRSVALSAPYFHDGSAKTLEEAVRYMASGGKADINKSALLVDTGMNDKEIMQVVEYLKSLTSDEPLVRPVLPK
jgi:cytochrome c peroxidase